MPIKINAHFAFETEAPTDVLLQFKAAHIPEQTIEQKKFEVTDTLDCATVAAQDDIGERIWLHSDGRVDVNYEALATIDRVLPDLPDMAQLPAHEMPSSVVQYMFDSRYCPADRFQSFVGAQFGDTTGGKRIQAIHDWIAENFSYVPGASGPNTTALDSFVERQGICRDYAHVMVTMARASTIPARFVSCYATGVTPQDFHAVAEVFLADPTIADGGMWHLVDATNMGTASDIVKIGVGRDAADVSFLTSFGPSSFIEKTIEVSQVGS